MNQIQNSLEADYKALHADALSLCTKMLAPYQTNA